MAVKKKSSVGRLKRRLATEFESDKENRSSNRSSPLRYEPLPLNRVKPKYSKLQPVSFPSLLLTNASSTCQRRSSSSSSTNSSTSTSTSVSSRSSVSSCQNLLFPTRSRVRTHSPALSVDQTASPRFGWTRCPSYLPYLTVTLIGIGIYFNLPRASFSYDDQ